MLPETLTGAGLPGLPGGFSQTTASGARSDGQQSFSSGGVQINVPGGILDHPIVIAGGMMLAGIAIVLIAKR